MLREGRSKLVDALVWWSEILDPFHLPPCLLLNAPRLPPEAA